MLLSLLNGHIDSESIDDDNVKALYNVLSKSGIKEHIFVLKSLLETLTFLETQIKKFDMEIAAKAKKFEDAIKTLMSVPGISFTLAVGILAEVGDINRFPSPRHLASYAGLAPTSRDSGGKRRSGKPSRKTNKYLRCFMFLAGMAAVRSNSRVVREFFCRLLERGKHYKVAVVAVARKLLCVIWHLLRRGDVWRGDGYFKSSRRFLWGEES